MSQTQVENKSVLAIQLIQYAYGNPVLAQIRFPNSVICPTCHAELAYVIQENETTRLLACFNCGTRYKTKEQAA